MADANPQHQSRLLSLPQEIKDQIWDHAFANIELQAYRNRHRSQQARYNDFTCCTPCARYDATLHPSNSPNNTSPDPIPPSPQSVYNTHIRPSFACKSMLEQSLAIFRPRLHLKSSEAIPWIRLTAPQTLKDKVQSITIAIHFDGSNHFLWLMRLLELQSAFPNLKRLRILYHMRPPTSYDNMLDAMYLSISILGLEEPLNRPVYVLPDGPTNPGPESGTTIETSYIETSPIFHADFLGEVTTDDAIEEHTKVISQLFVDASYRTAAMLVLNSNHGHTREHLGKYGAYDFPVRVQHAGFVNEAFLPVAQHTMLAIARSHEKGWFEGLMRKRIVKVWVENCGEERRGEIEAFVRSVPEGEGIERLIEAVLSRPGMAAMFGIEDGDA